jgi:hypothetical protein
LTAFLARFHIKSKKRCKISLDEVKLIFKIAKMKINEHELSSLDMAKAIIQDPAYQSKII